MKGWNFSLEEVSFGVYELIAKNLDGRQVKYVGSDLDDIKKKCFDAILEFDELE